MPWSGMKRVTNLLAGEVVEIPKFWFKWTKNGNALKLQIADRPVEGFLCSPAHMDRRDGFGERDQIYVGRYHCGSGYKSVTGVRPIANTTRSSFRTNIHNLGSTIWQMDYATRLTIWMLYLVEFADWNHIIKIGYGRGDGSNTQNMGYTDDMPYHTGTTLTSRTSFGCSTQYRWIEGLWDNVMDWMDGCYYNSNGFNVILNPNNFSDTSNSIVTMGGISSGGYPTVMSIKDDIWMYPTAVGGSVSSYVTNTWYFDSSYPCVRVGGYYSQSDGDGLFHVYYGVINDTHSAVGSRLMILP